MSGENFGRCNAQPGSGPGSQNDRYAYSGDGAGTNGANAANPNDRYRYSGDGTGNGNGQGPSGDSSADCNWRPDLSYSSPHARAWLAASKEQATHPIDRDASGMYTVKFGDSLSGIAARELRDEGQSGPIDRSQISNEVNRIIQANDQHYRSLDCNKDLIKEGWQLQIPRAQGDQGTRTGDRGTARGDQDNGDQPQCVRAPRDQQHRNYYDQSNQSSTTVYNIQNAYFYGDGRGGWTMGSPDSRTGSPERFTPRVDRDRGRSNNDQYTILLPNQGDQYPVAPRYNTTIPPVGQSNGYGWNRGACQSCGDNNGVYFQQPQGWDNGYQTFLPAQSPGIYLDLNLGNRSRFFEPPIQNWGRDRDRNRYSGTWQNNSSEGYTIQTTPFNGNNGRNGYSGQFRQNGSNGSNLNGSSEGYSIQTVPYNPNSGNHARTLLYNPSSGYRVTPINYSTANDYTY